MLGGVSVITDFESRFLDASPLLLSTGIDRYVLVVFELAFPAKILRKALCPARGGFLALFYVFAIEIA